MLAFFVAVAAAAPTLEEEALAELLAGRGAAAVQLLDTEATRGVAGRVALATRPGSAEPFFTGPSPADRWGRVDLAAARGQPAEAARLALAEMEAALGGEHRDALGALLLGWARERAATDPHGAARFVAATLGLEPGIGLRHAAEDLLARLLLPTEAWRLRRRHAEEPGGLSARLGAALAMEARRADRALELYAGIVAEAAHDDALAAATRLTTLLVPDAPVIAALAELDRRFPGDAAIDALRRRHAVALAGRDPALGTKLLAALAGDPPRPALLAEQARFTADPGARRQLWLRVAALEGASEAGDRARAAALEALLARVEGLQGAARREAARAALAEPDGAGLAVFHHWAGAGDEAALWSQAERFRDGPWCEDLAVTLLAGGVEEAEAERFIEPCGGHAGSAARVLAAAAEGAARLHLRPAEGAIEAWVAGKTVEVGQHAVDPEALFRATSGNPLDHDLDAWLLDPDESWLLTATTAARRVEIRPVGGGALSTLTVRAGDQRATAFVRPEPLEVQLLSSGEELAVGVLRQGRPVSASLLVQDGDGAFHEARATDGLALLRGVPGPVRVMARAGRGLGFATVGSANATTPSAAWALLPHRRAVAARGELLEVEVIGSGAVKAATLSSRDAEGELLAELPVPPGASRQRIFAVGGGSLVVDDGAASGGAQLQLPGAPAPVALWWSPAEPEQGTAVSVYAHSFSRLGAHTTLTTPAGEEADARPLEGTRAWTVDLAAEPDLDEPSLWIDLARGDRVHGTLLRREPEGPRVEAPAVAPSRFVPVARPGSWVLARGSGRVWARAGEALELGPGSWTLQAWDGSFGPELPLRVSPSVSDGRWTGAPTLVADGASHLEARWLLPGDAVAAPARPGAELAWRSLGTGEAFPIHGPAAPRIEVAGRLVHGAASLELGGLPEGTRIWALLQDAGGVDALPEAPEVAAGLRAEPAAATEAWRPAERAGEQIAAGLLAEEERVAEATRVERVDFGFSPAAEAAVADKLGASGYGSGGGGFGQTALGGIGTRGGGAIARQVDFHGDPAPLALLSGGAPGPWRVELPPWVVAADLRVVAALPDGRWTSRALRLAVEGQPELRPTPPPPAPPEAWDGRPEALVALAATLPAEAAAWALAALDQRGVAAARAPLRALPAGDGPLAAVSRKLRGLPAPAGADDAAIPELRRAERASAALALADRDPERARATASRVLATPGLEPWIRARAALALWVAGDGAAALAALDGDAPALGAARSLIRGRAEGDPAAWWTIARDEGADPGERALMIHALSFTSRPLRALPAAAAPALTVVADAPIASWEGQLFPRAEADGRWTRVPGGGEVPAGRLLPLWVELGPQALPTRLRCPDGAWQDLGPSPEARRVECRSPASARMPIRWVGPDGEALGEATWLPELGPARDSRLDDPMSPREALGLAVALAPTDPAARAVLDRLLATASLGPAELEAASTARLRAADGAELVSAFASYREHVPGGSLDLATAAGLARAYAAGGDPRRALAAVRVVMDARFKEELAAVSALQSGGLELTALKLLRELVARYPDVPTVRAARFLAPSMLLARADGEGDRLGYTRSSLRHTAAAELATFLLLHPDASQAPEAATILADTLHRLGDPARERGLAGLLATRYATSPEAWRLRLADARAALAEGDLGRARRSAATLPAEAEVELLRGRIAEADGRWDEARAAYDRSGRPEALARRAWLDRSHFALPETLWLRPGERAFVPAELPAGTELSVAAIRVKLESILLRDGGRIDLDAVSVEGLRPAAARSVKVGADGDVILPELPTGAYVLTVASDSLSQRVLLLRGELELALGPAPGGTLIRVHDTRGAPVADAQLWAFAPDGEVQAARTDLGGAAFVPIGVATALALSDEAYALHRAESGWTPPYEPAWEDSPSPVLKNADAYNELFVQDSRQRVRAEAL